MKRTAILGVLTAAATALMLGSCSVSEPRDDAGDRAFNTRFYTLASDMSAWTEETAGPVTIYTRDSGSSAISLRDASGALTSVRVPDGGSVVVAPGCIIVSRSAQQE